MVYSQEMSVAYALNIFRDTSLFNKTLHIRLSSHARNQNNSGCTESTNKNNTEIGSLRQGFNNHDLNSMHDSSLLPNQKNIIPNLMNNDALSAFGNNQVFLNMYQQMLASSSQVNNLLNMPYPSQTNDDRPQNYKMSHRTNNYRKHDYRREEHQRDYNNDDYKRSGNRHRRRK